MQATPITDDSTPRLDFAALAGPEPPETPEPPAPPQWEPKFAKGERVALKVPGKPLTLCGTIFSERPTEATVNVHWQSADLALAKKRKGNTLPAFEKGDAVTFHLDDDYTVAATFGEHHKKYGKCTLKTVWPIAHIEPAPQSSRKRAADDAPAQPAPPPVVLKVVCISRADFDGEPTEPAFLALLDTLARYISPVHGTTLQGTTLTSVLLIDGVADAIVEKLFMDSSPLTSGRRFTACALASPLTFADVRAVIRADPTHAICLAHSPSTPVASRLCALDMAVSDDSWATRVAASDAASPARSTTTTEPDSAASDSDCVVDLTDSTDEPAPKRARPEYIEID